MDKFELSQAKFNQWLMVDSKISIFKLVAEHLPKNLAGKRVLLFTIPNLRFMVELVEACHGASIEIASISENSQQAAACLKAVRPEVKILDSFKPSDYLEKFALVVYTVPYAAASKLKASPPELKTCLLKDGAGTLVTIDSDMLETRSFLAHLTDPTRFDRPYTKTQSRFDSLGLKPGDVLNCIGSSLKVKVVDGKSLVEVDGKKMKLSSAAWYIEKKTGIKPKHRLFSTFGRFRLEGQGKSLNELRAEREAITSQTS